MTIEQLRADLAAVLKIPAALYGFRGGYIKSSALVLSATGENAYKGNDANAERLREIAVDLYISGAGDDLPDALIDELERLCLPYRINTEVFESDTNLRHIEFITEI